MDAGGGGWVKKLVIFCGCRKWMTPYIGETVRNAQLRWNKHENGKDKNSKCTKHLNENDNHEFKWSILSSAPKISFKRKILEAYFIKTLNPILNNQLNINTFQKWHHLVSVA